MNWNEIILWAVGAFLILGAIAIVGILYIAYRMLKDGWRNYDDRS